MVVRRIALVLAAGALALAWTGSALASNALRVSQVYGGGGNSGAPYTHDYVEIFNAGTTAQALTGLSIQYASATGTGNFGANAGQLTELPPVSIAPGRYYLVQQGAGAGNGAPLPTPDLVDPTPIAMAAGAGKVALVTGTTSLGCNGGSNACSPEQLARIVDLVGYGNANFYEGSGAAPTLTNSTAALRKLNGCQDTDNNADDFTAVTPTPRNSTSPTHVCLTDNAPSVASTVPADGAANVAVDTTIQITFSEPVDVTGDWYSISCTTSGANTATASGGPVTFTLTPDADFAAGETCTVTVVAANVTDQDTDDPPDTMAADYVWSFSTIGPATKIATIQGAGHISPLVGMTVGRVEGVVTAKRSNGFYLQDPDPDADPATSDGIFVFTSANPAAIEVGDFVRVSGTVSEFRPGGTAASNTNLTITQISSNLVSVIVLSSGNTLPAPTVVGMGGRMPPTEVIHVGSPTGTVESGTVFDPDTNGLDFYETLEGMLVQVNGALAVGPTNNFGEIPVVPDNGAWSAIRTIRGGLLVRDLTPGSPGDYSQGDFNPERIQLDDEIVRPAPRVNVGDGFATAAVGVMDYSFGNYKLQLTQPLDRVDNGLEREVTRASRDQELAVATFNVENLHPGSGGQFAQLADLIVNNLRSPDLIGIEEVQDNSGPTNNGVTDASVTWSMLVAAIETAGGPTYEWRDIAPVDGQDGGQPGGNIRVGFLYRTDRGLEFVDRPGGTATNSTQPVAHPSGVRLTFSPGRVDALNPAWASSRKPLAGEFRFRGKKVIAIVNHFNSKGGDQALFGRYQPPIRLTETQRHGQASSVNAFVRDVLDKDPDALVVVNGDINDFDFSETVRILESGDALTTLMKTLPLAERYSYVFEGNSQVLDQTLASPALLARLVDYDVVHVNSEFHDQASDHEPQVARFWMVESDRQR
jgi:uncharacterized protein